MGMFDNLLRRKDNEVPLLKKSELSKAELRYAPLMGVRGFSGNVMQGAERLKEATEEIEFQKELCAEANIKTDKEYQGSGGKKGMKIWKKHYNNQWRSKVQKLCRDAMGKKRTERNRAWWF